MHVLLVTVFGVLSVNSVIGQYNDQTRAFNAPANIERGFVPLRSYFEKDSSPASTYENLNYGQNSNSYSGNYQSQNQNQPPPQYVFMPQAQALTSEPPQYGPPQVPDAISNYLAVVAQKYGSGPQNSPGSRQGPQVFVPPQMPRPSPFQAPDQYQFVPPEQQQYQPPTQQYQQPPVQFNQPEFANIQPAVPFQPQYSNQQPQYSPEQTVQYQSPEGLGQLPPITRNPNDLTGHEGYTEAGQNNNRPPPTKYVKGSHFIGPTSYSELSDFGTSGLDDGNFGGFGGFGGFDGKYGGFGGFETSFEDFPGSSLTSLKLASIKPKGSSKPSGSGGPSSKRNHRFSRGSIIGIRRPTRYILSSN